MRYLFPKERRFKPVKLISHEISHLRPKVASDFNQVTKRAKSGISGFGVNSPRFDYYASRRKQGTLPSPVTYSKTTLPTRRGKSGLEHKSFSFGVSRSEMNKIHIDEIIDPSLKK